MGQSPYLSRGEASRYLLSQHSLRRSLKYLAKLAVIGGGPAFHKANRAVLYDPTDLDAYAARVIGPAAYSNMEHRLVAATKHSRLHITDDTARELAPPIFSEVQK